MIKTWVYIITCSWKYRSCTD